MGEYYGSYEDIRAAEAIEQMIYIIDHFAPDSLFSVEIYGWRLERTDIDE